MRKIICEHGKCTLVNDTKSRSDTEFAKYNIVKENQKILMKKRKEFLS